MAHFWRTLRDMDAPSPTAAKVLRPAFRWHGRGAFEGDLGQPCQVARGACESCVVTWFQVARKVSPTCPFCGGVATVAVLGGA